MSGWLVDLAASLSGNPWLQGLLAGLATFILEDPTTVGAGLLVADRRMLFTTALIGVAGGIALGDVGLYGLGRLFGPRSVRWGLLSQPRLDQASAWFGRNLVSAVVLSRFVPGMRLPTYLGAGVLRAPFLRFVGVAVAASVVWTLMLLSLTVAIGEAVLPLLGKFRWPVAGAAVLLMLVLQRRAARSFDGADEQVVSPFEFWPPWLFYIPVGFYYVWLTLRYRGTMLPTVANPSIFSGGLIGESKSQILDLVPAAFRRFVAPYVVVERADPAEARRAIAGAGLAYPLVAKPDVGQRGDGVRPIRSDAELGEYVESFPPAGRIVFQTLVGSGEAGILYWRSPDSDRGNIFSITLKQFPEVRGDGRRTLRELVEADPRARKLAHVYLERHARDVDRVLSTGEVLPLVFAGNHCKGAVFTDGTALATPALLERLHGIATAMPEFYFGRFDVRFDDFDAFLRGEDLQIIEINGAGAEATHIWDASARLSDAYRTLFRQFKILFSIGAANRRRGHRPLGVVRFLREALAYRRVSRAYPLTH